MPSRTATLTWRMSTEADLAGYKVYQGTASSGDYSVVSNVGLTASTGSPTATMTGLQHGKTYYFALTAYDLTGNESTFSAQASKGPILFELTHIQRSYP